MVFNEKKQCLNRNATLGTHWNAEIVFSLLCLFYSRPPSLNGKQKNYLLLIPKKLMTEKLWVYTHKNGCTFTTGKSSKTVMESRQKGTRNAAKMQLVNHCTTALMIHFFATYHQSITNYKITQISNKTLKINWWLKLLMIT